jgi:GTPase
MARKISKNKRRPERAPARKPAIGNMPFAETDEGGDKERAARKAVGKAMAPRPAVKRKSVKRVEAPPVLRRHEEDRVSRSLKIPAAEGPHRTGFISIAGRPNAGKSTLLNTLVGEKVAIVAPQAQTTRTSVQGILSLPNAQVVFTDTPGIHKSDSLFNKRMMDTVRGAVEDRDLVFFVADATKPVATEDEHAVGALKKSGRAFLLLNKIDEVADKRELLPLIAAYAKLHSFEEVFPICARTGQGVAAAMTAALAVLPEGPAVFPDDQFTDQPMRFLAAELIRERVLRAASKEVPHAVAVLVDEWDERPQLTRIAATILVERPGQKAILIGAGGTMLKRISSEARQEIERLVGQKVFLSLFVRVQPKWREDPQFLQLIDWRAMVGSK